MELNCITVNGNAMVARRNRRAKEEAKAKTIVGIIYVIGIIILTIIITQAVITSTAKATVNKETGAIIMEIAGHTYEYYE